MNRSSAFTFVCSFLYGNATRKYACHKVVSGLVVIQAFLVLLTVSAKAETTAQFRLAHRFAVIVPITIDDNGPYEFLLDTGTNTSMISKELAGINSLRIVDY